MPCSAKLILVLSGTSQDIVLSAMVPYHTLKALEMEVNS